MNRFYFHIASISGATLIALAAVSPTARAESAGAPAVNTMICSIFEQLNKSTPAVTTKTFKFQWYGDDNSHTLPEDGTYEYDSIVAQDFHFTLSAGAAFGPKRQGMASVDVVIKDQLNGTSSAGMLNVDLSNFETKAIANDLVVSATRKSGGVSVFCSMNRK